MKRNVFLGLLLVTVIVIAGCGGGGGSSGNSSGNSGNSKTSTACTPPATPTGLKVVPQYSEVTGHHNLVSWNPVPLGDYSWVHYNLYRTKSPTISIHDTVVRLDWPNAYADDSDVEAPYIKYYAVTATNGCGESAISYSVLADGSSKTPTLPTTDPSTNPSTSYPLPAPTNFKVTKTGDTTWQMSWDPVTGADEYFVYENLTLAPPVKSGRNDFSDILDDVFFSNYIPDGTSDSGSIKVSGTHCWIVVAAKIDPSDYNFDYLGYASATQCVYFPATVNPPATVSTGSVSIWTDNSTTISSVSIDNVSSGSLTSFFASGTPTCGQSGTITKTLPVGTHTIKASNSEQTWASTNVTITANNCTLFKLSGTNTGGTGGGTSGGGSCGTNAPLSGKYSVLDSKQPWAGLYYCTFASNCSALCGASSSGSYTYDQNTKYFSLNIASGIMIAGGTISGTSDFYVNGSAQVCRGDSCTNEPSYFHFTKN